MLLICDDNVPFETQMDRDIHFQKHGRDFGAADAASYEQMADAFMYGAKNQTTMECRRPNLGDRLRFDRWNRRFACSSVQPDFLRTFYIVPQGRVNAKGGEIAYFGWECGRINL